MATDYIDSTEIATQRIPVRDLRIGDKIVNRIRIGQRVDADSYVEIVTGRKVTDSGWTIVEARSPFSTFGTTYEVAPYANPTTRIIAR